MFICFKHSLISSLFSSSDISTSSLINVTSPRIVESGVRINNCNFGFFISEPMLSLSSGDSSENINLISLCIFIAESRIVFKSFILFEFSLFSIKSSIYSEYPIIALIGFVISCFILFNNILL